MRSPREEQALAEIGHTEVSRPAALALLVVFLATILAVPVLQQVKDLVAEGPRLPQSYDIFRLLPSPGELAAVRDLAGLRRLLPRAADIRDYEHRLEERSILREAALPYAQLVLTQGLATGNEQVEVGREGWLFYRPDVEYVTAPGFLGRARRVRPSEPPPAVTDPVAGILDFHAQLAARGIGLVVVPTPGKPMIHPDSLTRSATAEGPLQNPSFPALRAALEAAGVVVFDPAPLLWQRRSATGTAQYLKTDSHWTPEAMEATAREIALVLRERFSIGGPSGTFERGAHEVEGLGDLAAMLRLPGAERVFAPERVRLRPVSDASGEAWRPASAAEVLLLGDSFSNIYSAGAMAWGASAGLAEQLSVETGLPIDRIVRNDGGSIATRREIAQQQAAGVDRLAGKKVVIWQFAVRALAIGDWSPVALAPPGEPRKAPTTDGEVPVPASRVVRATVVATAGVPAPGSVPYPDCFTALHLSDIEPADAAPFATDEAVAYVLAMRGQVWTAAARIAPGDRVELRLVPWAAGEERYGSINRSELPDERLIDLPAYWGELLP